MMRLEQRKVDLEKEYKEKIAEIDKSIEENINKYEFLKDLLTESGDKLVSALKLYFDCLGFKDVRIIDGDDLYIIEIRV